MEPQALPQPEGLHHLERLATTLRVKRRLSAEDCKRLHGVADELDRQREAEDAGAKAAAELEAECRLVAEELGRATGVGLKATILGSAAGRVELAAPDQAITIARDGLWWRLYLAAAREVRRLRLELEREQHGQPSGFGWHRREVDPLAERILGLLEAEALRLFASADDARDHGQAHVARRIAEDLCR